MLCVSFCNCSYHLRISGWYAKHECSCVFVLFVILCIGSATWIGLFNQLWSRLIRFFSLCVCVCAVFDPRWTVSSSAKEIEEDLPLHPSTREYIRQKERQAIAERMAVRRENDQDTRNSTHNYREWNSDTMFEWTSSCYSTARQPKNTHNSSCVYVMSWTTTVRHILLIRLSDGRMKAAMQ